MNKLILKQMKSLKHIGKLHFIQKLKNIILSKANNV